MTDELDNKTKRVVLYLVAQKIIVSYMEIINRNVLLKTSDLITKILKY